MITPDSRQASSGVKKTSFLPEPDFNPIYPSPNTLPARWRLSAVIFTLKELGWHGGIVRPFRTIAGMPDPHNQPLLPAAESYSSRVWWRTMTRAAIVISRIMAVLHPDCALLAALLCLLLWGCL